MESKKYIFYNSKHGEEQGFYPILEITKKEDIDISIVKFSRFNNKVCCRKKIENKDLPYYIYSDKEVAIVEKMLKNLLKNGYTINFSIFRDRYTQDKLFCKENLILRLIETLRRNGQRLPLRNIIKLRYMFSRMMHFKLEDYNRIMKEDL